MRHREKAVLKPRALELHGEGLAPARIAERLGLPSSTVSEWLRQEGIGPVPRTRRGRTPTLRTVIERLRSKWAEEGK